MFRVAKHALSLAPMIRRQLVVPKILSRTSQAIYYYTKVERQNGNDGVDGTLNVSNLMFEFLIT